MTWGIYPEGRKTIFLDIDGTILRFKGTYSDAIKNPHLRTLLKGTVELFLEWEAEGSYIVLTTARKECLREITEKQLLDHGLFWDQLIMGLGNGPRLLINDRKPNGDNSAYVINVQRNEGLVNIKPNPKAGPPHDK